MEIIGEMLVMVDGGLVVEEILAYVWKRKTLVINWKIEITEASE